MFESPHGGSSPSLTAMVNISVDNWHFNNNRFCPYCLTTCKGNKKCGKCGQETIVVSYRARIPKQDAHRKEWEALFNAFPNILKRAPYTKALADMGFKTKEDNKS